MLCKFNAVCSRLTNGCLYKTIHKDFDNVQIFMTYYAKPHIVHNLPYCSSRYEVYMQFSFSLISLPLNGIEEFPCSTKKITSFSSVLANHDWDTIHQRITDLLDTSHTFTSNQELNTRSRDTTYRKYKPNLSLFVYFTIHSRQ